MQAFGHADDCGCDRRIIWIRSDVLYEGAVDLELANSKPPQGGEVGVPSSEVVNRQYHSSRL